MAILWQFLAWALTRNNTRKLNRDWSKQIQHSLEKNGDIHTTLYLAVIAWNWIFHSWSLPSRRSESVHEGTFWDKAAHSTDFSAIILCEAGGGLHQAESCLWRWPDNLINSVYFVVIVADAEPSFSSPSSIFHPVSSFNRLFFSPGLRMASRGRWLQSPGHRTRRFPWPEVWPSWAFFPLVLPHLDILR